MKQRLTQEQKLTWKITQQLSQAIEILQYNGYDLHQFLQEQMSENPLIEVETAGEEQFSSVRRHISSQTSVTFDDFQTSPKSLYDLLKEQIIHFDLSEEQRAALEYGIDSLDERGYLTITLEEWAEGSGTSLEVAEECLRLLQSMDPPGIGARSLQECLKLQLAKKKKSALLIDLIEQHIGWVADHSLNEIAEHYEISLAEAKELINEIQSCQPKPGLLLQQKQSDYIVPDGEVIQEQGTWKVKLYIWNSPSITVNRSYLREDTFDDEARDFAKKYVRHGDWLIRAIETRRVNLLTVFQKIVEKQVSFFHYGPAMLRPLTLQEVADEVNLHVSTVSRAVKDKYLQTPRGVLPVKFFFQQGIHKKDGGQTSAHTTKMLIKELVEEEDPAFPLSDQQISQRLQNGFGIRISRRTVAKYRETLNIPSSFKRKRSI